MKKILLLLVLVGIFTTSCKSTSGTTTKQYQETISINVPESYMPLDLSWKDKLKEKGLRATNLYLSEAIVLEDQFIAGYQKELDSLKIVNGEVQEKKTHLIKEDKNIPGYTESVKLQPVKYSYFRNGILYVNYKGNPNLAFVPRGNQGIYILNSSTINGRNIQNKEQVAIVFKYSYSEETKIID